MTLSSKTYKERRTQKQRGTMLIKTYKEKKNDHSAGDRKTTP
jgi:hypothetical protein